MPLVKKLIEGYKRFRGSYYQENKDLLLRLAEGQQPKTAIVSCCDSRVEPSIILDCEPGDLFVIRNVANLVPPSGSDDSFHGTSAALEFAVTGLQVENIVVMGHSKCGGIKFLVDGQVEEQKESYISTWMKQLNKTKEKVLGDSSLTTQEERYHACEYEGVKQSLENLMEFPWVRSRVEEGSLKLHGLHYNLGEAELYSLQEQTGKFAKIT